jgi:peroxiredoxin
MKLTLPALALAALFAAPAPGAEDSQQGWIILFDGTEETFKNWKINEKPDSWKFHDGVLTANGERSHIFYMGPEAPFKDFELQLDVMTQPNSNSGVYIHTKYQDEGWPKAGFECQVNNTYNSDPRKTGSVYAVKDVNKAPVGDNEWWKYTIRVEGDKITLKVNDKVVNEYVQPADAKAGQDFERVLGSGTFALQAHDPGSTVSYRNIRVKKLAAADSSKEKSVSDSSGVSVGDKAPAFTLKDDQGNEWNSAEHFKEGITVVYFYPADFTGGCTKQACSYRDDFGELKNLGVDVVGVSGDSVETHKAFKQAHNLNFPLLADPEGKAAKAFGVPVTLGEKSASYEGKNFIRTATIQRWTIVVKDGKVAAINNKVNAAADSENIRELVKGLK